MQKWEYADLYWHVDKWLVRVKTERKEIVLDEKKLVEVLDQLGEDGWELVASANYHYFLKRLKS